MNILVVGLGSIGTRQARILRDRLKCDVAALRFKGRGNALGLPEYYSWKDAAAAGTWDAAIIANPTHQHIPAALKCAAMKMNVFIEKPLSGNSRGIAALRSLCRRNGVLCYVAYPLRFHPVILKARELLATVRPFYARAVCASYLPDWRPGRDVKTVFSSKRREGGGVILELSHEFDYFSFLFGPLRSISGVKGRISGVTVDSEDFTDADLVFPKGLKAQIHLDYFSRRTERWFQVDFADGFLRGDLTASTLIFSCRGREQVLNFSADRDDYLEAQLRYFLGRIGKKDIMNDLREATPLLEKLLRFRHA
ncbi:MAG: Gfo/Idh/MocA family oxidoreductase [Candidatus Omnitrophica bacterium]|nr:Gfo/Idh/MocA family oxidoreductase [Candidatus Omnitrophota bacterium]